MVEKKQWHEIEGDLWDVECDALCITTNGFVTLNGACVMGRGCAYEASQRYPEIKTILGKQIKQNGNVVNYLLTDEPKGLDIYAFPVKPVSGDTATHKAVKHFKPKPKTTFIPGFYCVAELAIIEDSLKQLVKITNDTGYNKVVLPRPGCGAGELDYKEVKVLLDKYLDDRFYIITFKS